MFEFRIKIDGAPLSRFSAGVNAAIPTPERREKILKKVAEIIRIDIVENYINQGDKFGAIFTENSPKNWEYKSRFWQMMRAYELPREFDTPLVQVDTGGTARALLTGEKNDKADGVFELSPEYLRMGVILKYNPTNKEVLIGFSKESFSKIEKLLIDDAREIENRVSNSPVPRGLE